MLVLGLACDLPLERPAERTAQAPQPATRAFESAWPPLDAAFLTASAATQSFRLGAPQPLAVAPDGSVLFRRTPPRDKRAALYLLDPKGGVSLLADADTLLRGASEQLSVKEQARRERTRTALSGIVDAQLSDDGKRVLVALGERVFVIDREVSSARELALGEGYPLDPRLSPDGQWVAFVRDGDLWVAGTDGTRGVPKRLARHEEGFELATPEFIAQEELERHNGYVWSPDSRSIAFQRTDHRPVQTLYVSDPRHPERPPVPFKFPRAGTDNAVVDLGIVRIAGGPPRYLQWDLARYPYLARLQWPKASPLSLVVQNRAQTELALLTVDASSGAITQLHVQRDPAWVPLKEGSPAWLPDGSGFLILAETEAGFSLERFARDGTHVASLTHGNLGARAIAGIEPDGQHAIVLAGPDPREQHVYRVPLEASATGAPTPLQALTSGGGVHHALAESGVVVVSSLLREGGTAYFAIDPRAQLGVAQPGLAQPSRRLLPSVAERPPIVPTTELQSVEVEGRRLHVAITRPRAPKPNVRYPVLLKVYGGPGVHRVFDARDFYSLDQWYADAGFVVIRIDGRGTPDRGRAFERAISLDLISVPLSDQAGALEALLARDASLDRERVGIFGWSFGGYVAGMALLLRPDLFKAAVAGAPVSDWALYDTAYTERYLRTPLENPEGYARGNMLALAPRLSRPLLLIHGVTDDNVHVAHSLALIEALHAAGKRAEVVLLSSTHMVKDPQLAFAREQTQVDFFRKHLGPPR